MLCELSSLEKKGKKKKDGHISLRLASFLSEHPLVSLVMGSSHELTLCSTPSSLLEEGNSPSLEVLVCVCVQWSPKMGYGGTGYLWEAEAEGSQVQGYLEL